MASPDLVELEFSSNVEDSGAAAGIQARDAPLLSSTTDSGAAAGIQARDAPLLSSTTEPDGGRSRISKTLEGWTMNWARRQTAMPLAHPQPDWVMRRIQRMQSMIISFLLIMAVLVVVVAYAAIRAWMLVLVGSDASCDQLSAWDFWMAMTLTALPVLFMMMGPYLIWLALNGQFILQSIPAECCEASPALCGYTAQVPWLVAAVMICTGAATAVGFLVSRRAGQLRSMLGSSGPAADAVLAHIACLPPPAAAQLEGAECAICLEGGGRRAEWRQLPCDHLFHRRCMAEWLKRARRCPLCRLDLQRAYLEEGGSPDAGDGSPQGTPPGGGAQSSSPRHGSPQTAEGGLREAEESAS